MELSGPHCCYLLLTRVQLSSSAGRSAAQSHGRSCRGRVGRRPVPRLRIRSPCHCGPWRASRRPRWTFRVASPSLMMIRLQSMTRWLRRHQKLTYYYHRYHCGLNDETGCSDACYGHGRFCIYSRVYLELVCKSPTQNFLLTKAS